MSRKQNPISSCLRIFLLYLEDPRYPSVGPILSLLSLIGLWHPNNSKLEKFKIYLLYVTVAVFCSQYVKFLTKLDAESLMLLLQYAPFHLGIVKTCLFQRHYKKWEKIIFYVSTLERDQLSKKNEQSLEIRNYIEKGRRVTYCFWSLVVFSNLIIFTEPYRKNYQNENSTKVYTHMFDLYLPSNSDSEYYLSMAIQTVLGNMVSAYVVAWDTLVVTIMVFFAGQLKVARINCRNIFKNGSYFEAQRNIVLCHQHHTSLVKRQKQFNELISQVMALYLVFVSVNLGVCIIQITELRNNVATLLWGCQFLLTCLVQLLLFYWHANEVTVESGLVSYSTFESGWLQSPASMQRNIALLGLTTKTRLIFRAGPCNEMSLQTFLAILRASYSFYTLLSKTDR